MSPTVGAFTVLTPPTSPRRMAQALLGRHRTHHGDSNIIVPELPSSDAANHAGAIRMTGTVWKRRSGFGKYSVSAAWERRYLVLRGTTLWYYKMCKDGTLVVDDAGAALHNDEQLSPIPDAPSATGTGPATSNPMTASALLSGQSIFPSSSKSKGSWLEQTVNKASASLGMHMPGESGATTGRGHLDIVKEKASVGASFGHSGAPTPFALSIKLNGITKWKLCFDTHKDLMQWLAILTDIIAQASVDAYNKEILQIHDPTVDTTLTFAGQLSEPPNGGNAGDGKTGKDRPVANGGHSPPPPPRKVSKHKDFSGHRLWSLGPYTVRNLISPAPTGQHIDDSSGSTSNEAEEEATSVSIDDADEGHAAAVDDAKSASHQTRSLSTASPHSVSVMAAGTSSHALDEANPKWTIADSSLFYAGVTLNLALVFTRSSAITSTLFWYVVVFANMLLFSHLQRERPTVVTVAVPSTAQHKMGVEASTQARTSRKKTSSAKKNPKRAASKPNAASDPSQAIEPSMSSDSHDSVEHVALPKPLAGTTAMQIENPRDTALNADGHRFVGWRCVPPSGIHIRSQGYISNGKKKIPSPGELYKLVYTDAFESPNRYPDMASRVQLPKVSFDGDKDGTPKTWNAPDIFVISVALPTDPPKMTKSSNDGGGFTITMYFVMKQETRDILRRVTAEGYDPSKEPPPEDPQKSIVNAVKLFEEWCRRAPTDEKFMARFKCVPNAQNLAEIGLPSWISSYNGKPFLIKRAGQTGFLYRHPEMSCMEFDISLHPFPYLAKKGICFMKDTYFKKVLVTFGFTIEGHTDDELPECLIGLMQLCYPDPAVAIQASDVFAGNSPKSHGGSIPEIVNGEFVNRAVNTGGTSPS